MGKMEEALLRVELQAYGATIDPSGQMADANVRMATVCAALVSLLVVCCIVTKAHAAKPGRVLPVSQLDGSTLE